MHEKVVVYDKRRIRLVKSTITVIFKLFFRQRNKIEISQPIDKSNNLSNFLSQISAWKSAETVPLLRIVPSVWMPLEINHSMCHVAVKLKLFFYYYYTMAIILL